MPELEFFGVSFYSAFILFTFIFSWTMQVTIEIPDGLPPNMIRQKLQEIQEMFEKEVNPLPSEK